MSTVIKVENLSKSYRLGSISTGSLHKDLQSFWARVRGKEDPNRRIGETGYNHSKGDLFWALKDVSFEVKQGQVLGILGRNGAGKSTLLKILSRITAPSHGSVKIRGRIASLLEVGTGFHPELTGRENVYLNGAILGMTKREIDRKFDEIIDFAEIEQFIDTPVKRYSSGMYVRLAFAVAAHLEPEILIVDEVLAVGDAQFQKKCLGKMGEVGREGRTILFVSHNVAAIRQLCNAGLHLDQGITAGAGHLHEEIEKYLATSIPKGSGALLAWDLPNAPQGGGILIEKIMLSNDNPTTSIIDIRTRVTITIIFQILEKRIRPLFNLVFFTIQGDVVFGSLSNTYQNYEHAFLPEGKYECKAIIPGSLLNNLTYSIQVNVFSSFWHNYAFSVKERLYFEVHDNEDSKGDFTGSFGGVVRPLLTWQLEPI